MGFIWLRYMHRWYSWPRKISSLHEPPGRHEISRSELLIQSVTFPAVCFSWSLWICSVWSSRNVIFSLPESCLHPCGGVSPATWLAWLVNADSKCVTSMLDEDFNLYLLLRGFDLWVFPFGCILLKTQNRASSARNDINICHTTTLRYANNLLGDILEEKTLFPMKTKREHVRINMENLMLLKRQKTSWVNGKTYHVIRQE